jgi:succinate dehydrogenase/fumarate reductase-like Fe-S protein
VQLKLRVWRQKSPTATGRFEDYDVADISEEMSFLELFDVLNDRLVADGKGRSPSTTTAVRICGSCSMMINGRAHGPRPAPPPASCTCAVCRRRQHHRRAVAARVPRVARPGRRP